MQICRFHEPGSGPVLGVIQANVVYNATRAGVCASLQDLLCSQDPWALARTVVEQAPPGHSLSSLDRAPAPDLPHLLAPIDSQEVWASGVTYSRSRDARVLESASADIYTKVYHSDRPELFFKGTPHRTVGPNALVTIRSDSTWNVPEPELAIVLTPDLRIVGYTIGNDISSRSIEGENPLYLPQAKIWTGSCAVGPIITLAEPGSTNPPMMTIRLCIRRKGDVVSSGEISTGQMKRQVSDLVEYLGRANTFPTGVILLTGTGIVPDDHFSLTAGDEVEIEIPGIGILRNGTALAL